MDRSFKRSLESVLETYKVGFHVPGHNRGRIFKELGCPDTVQLTMDTTEIPGTDNLHHPEGLIKESQERARAFYGSKQTFFLVNGSTCGNYAMMMSVCKPGDCIIMGRDSHRSVYNGLLLGQLKPIYLYPEIRQKDQLPLGYHPEALEDLLKQHPDAKAVFITRPNYYGVCSDIKALAEVCRRYDVPLLVDEAHGAHLKLHPDLPCSAIDGGADLVVQSVHKTLPALTQSSLLHVCSERIDLKRLKLMLQIHQSSSPSYLLMNSIDQAVRIAERYGSQKMRIVKKEIEDMKLMFKEVPGVEVPGPKMEGYERDVTKMLMGLKALGMSGFELEEVLRERYGIQLEMSNWVYGVGIATIGNEISDFRMLREALQDLVSKQDVKTTETQEMPLYPREQTAVLTLSESVYAPSETVELDQSEGRLSKEFIIPYPPGIPILVPGEKITGDMITYVQKMRAMKNSMLGMADASGIHIDVVVEEA